MATAKNSELLDLSTFGETLASKVARLGGKTVHYESEEEEDHVSVLTKYTSQQSSLHGEQVRTCVAVAGVWRLL